MQIFDFFLEDFLEKTFIEALRSHEVFSLSQEV